MKKSKKEKRKVGVVFHLIVKGILGIFERQYPSSQFLFFPWVLNLIIGDRRTLSQLSNPAGVKTQFSLIIKPKQGKFSQLIFNGNKRFYVI